MNKPLYEIETEFADLFARLEAMANAEQDESSFEETEALLKELEINRDELQRKAGAYAARIGQKESRAEYLKSEAKRLGKMAEQEQREADFLKERITKALISQDLKKVETDHHKLSLRSSVSVLISVPTDQLPEAYQRVTVKAEPDKQSIKQALQAGMSVPGAHLVEKQSLQIR